MSTFDYSGVIATAKSLVDRFGKTMIRITTVTSGEEWNPTIVETSTNITGVMTSYKSNQIDGTLIKATDKKVLTYDEIELTDLIVDDSISYNVISVFSINPGDTKLIYKVQLRQ